MGIKRRTDAVITHRRQDAENRRVAGDGTVQPLDALQDDQGRAFPGPEESGAVFSLALERGAGLDARV